MPVHRTRDSLSLPAHALEVDVNAPPAPTLTIVSPTPRAFTFPSNLHDATPRASDFQHNLQEDFLAAQKELAVSPKTPTSAASPIPDFRALDISRHIQSSPAQLSPISACDSPISPLSAVAASIHSGSHSHSRRPSLTSSISFDRKPKKGDEDYVKRPENAFILFRRECCLQKNAAEAAAQDAGTPAQRRQRQADLSKSISQQWKQLTQEERAYWDERAKQRKKEHEELYPWYVYQPTRTKERRKSPSKSRKGSRSTSSTASSRTDSSSFTSESDEFFADSEDADYGSAMGPDGNGNLSTTFAIPSRRASSAPTPPPAYPGIKIPTLFTPSCPSSPKLVGVARQAGQVHTRLLAPPDPSVPYGYMPMEMSQMQMQMQMQYGVEAMEANGQVPVYSSSNESIYQNFYDLSTQNVQISQRSNLRPLTAITIPSAQTQEHQPFSASSQSFSPSSLPSASSMPITPAHRANMQQFSPAISSPLAGPSSAPLSVLTASSSKDAAEDADKADGGDWSSYGLPAWAVPTLWAPNMSTPGFMQYSEVPEGDVDVDVELEIETGDIDFSNIPPLSLDSYLFDHSGHDFGSSISMPDFPEDISESLGNLSFPFDELLHASQL